MKIPLSILMLLPLGTALADPTMTVELQGIFTGEYDAAHPGEEVVFSYGFTNTSPSGDVNNMIEGWIDAGTDSGVYRVEVNYNGPGSVTGRLESGRSGIAGVVPPEDAAQGVFFPDNYVELYLYCSAAVAAVPGQATAVAEGEFYGGPGFAPVPVEVPGFSGPRMNVMLDATNVADYLPEHPGLERLWQYTITNNSPPGDVSNMIEWKIDAGIEDGVLAVETQAAGNSSMNGVLTATTAGFTGVLIPDPSFNQNVGYVNVFTSLGVAAVPGQATAVAEGEFDGGPTFPPIPVEVPGPVGLEVTLGEAVPVEGGMEVVQAVERPLHLDASRELHRLSDTGGFHQGLELLGGCSPLLFRQPREKLTFLFSNPPYDRRCHWHHDGRLMPLGLLGPDHDLVSLDILPTQG